MPSAENTLPIVALRSALEPFGRKRNAYAIALLVIDLLLFALGQWLAVAASSAWLQILGALVTWAAIVRLFVIGHDACHQALTSSPNLNHLIGRIAFAVSLTPYSLWRVGHNVVHHGFNNLRRRDFIWEPKHPGEYLALPPWRRAVERVYRSALGPALYYFVEIWWKRLFFPNRRQMATPRWEFKWDSLLAAAVGFAWVWLIHSYTSIHGTNFWPALLAAGVVPFVLWNWTVGLVVYLHHTHPELHWYSDKREWQQSKAQVSATAHIILPWALGAAMHHIMEHPAHHLNPTIPLYHLTAAQRRLREVGASFTSTPLTLRHYLRCTRTCKLYDYGRKSWMPFPAGRVARRGLAVDVD